MFENANGNLLKLVHGTKCVAQQIVNRFLLHRATPHFTAKYAVSERVKEFCLEMTVYPRVKSFTKYQDTVALGSGRVKKTTDDDRTAFLSAQRHVPEEVVVHRRMLYKGLVYTSKSYSLSKRRQDFYAKLNDGSHGQIHSSLFFTSDGAQKLFYFSKSFIHSHPSHCPKVMVLCHMSDL